MKTKQLQLTGFEKIGEKKFGGSFRSYKRKKDETRGRKKLKRSALGNARSARPITVKRPMHLVMRSSHATGSKSFLCSERALKIQSIIKKQESRFGVKVYEYANSGNHLHMVVRPRSRKAFQGFLRSISGLIARTTMNTERGLNKTLLSEVKKTKTTPQKTTKKTIEEFTEKNTGKNTEKFWDALPFTRILDWGKELKIVTQYLEQNMLEAYGFATKRKPLKLNFQYG